MMRRTILDCMTLVGTTPSRFDGEKAYVSTGAVDCDHIDYTQTESVTYGNRPSRANLSVTEGDILFARMCGTKKTLRISKTMADHLYSTGFCAVRANESIMLPELLYHLLASEQFLSQKDQNSSGATQKAITNAGLKKITVNVPSLDEQRKLAAKLDCIEDMAAKRREQLAKLDELVKSRFIELFGDVSDFVNITDIAHTYIGLVTTMTKHYCSSGTPLLFNSSIKSDKIVWDGTYLDAEFAEANKSRMHKTNDIVTVHTGDIGTSAVVGEELNNSLGFATIVTRINDTSRYYPRFVSSFLNYGSGKEQLKKYSRDVRNNLNLKDFNRLMVPNVSALEQKRYVDFVEQTDKSKLEVQQSLEKLEILKNSLMQQYFG